MKKIILILILSLFVRGSGFAATGVMTFVTKEEGALRDAPSLLYKAGNALNDGPEIEIVTPDSQKSYKSPVKIIVSFFARNGKKIDLTKLKVEYLKMFAVDLTKRVLPYTSEEGIKIEKAELPSGNHKIRITLADAEGGVTQQVFLFVVSD